MKEETKPNGIDESTPLSEGTYRIKNPEYYQINGDSAAVYRLKNLIRIFLIVVLLVVFLLLILYGATVIAGQDAAYPVKVNGEGGHITLYATEEMDEPTSHLSIPVIEAFDPLSAAVSIPANVDSSGIGSKNGKGYIAYTFLVKNNDEKSDLPISEKIAIVSSTKNADKAIRVRVYRNGTPTTYAAASASGMPEYGTIPFASDDTVFETSAVLSAGQTTKYTIVVWIEGDDPECVNEIGGGSLRLSVQFSADIH